MCVMKRYREYDPNTVEAVQFTGKNGDEVIKLLDAMGGAWTTLKREFDEDTGEEVSKRIPTLEIIYGTTRYRAFQGDYVIKTRHGGIYMVDEKTFLARYEEIQ